MGNLDRRDFVKAAGALGLTVALREFGWSMATAAEEAGPMPMRALGRTGLKVGILGLGGYHATMHEIGTSSPDSWAYCRAGIAGACGRRDEGKLEITNCDFKGHHSGRTN